VTQTGTPAERRELERINAFSDGVFAIAITLLVLNVEVPSVPSGELGEALSGLGDDFTAYCIGFAVMGLFWYGHHRLFARLVRSNGRLVLVNMVLLGLVGLMPFTTGTLGNYDEPEVVALYAANVGVATIFDGLLHLVAIRDRLEEEPDDLPARRAERREALVWTPVRAAIFLLSIPVAYLATPGIAQWLWFGLIGVVFLRRWV
jgi:uncharacterized membrane protein